jgi:hypothetical protein
MLRRREPQLATEAINAAGHFGNTTAAANRDSQYVIISPHGTDPDGWLQNGFCAWHDYNGDLGVSSPFGDIALTNLPYITDAGASCGQSVTVAVTDTTGAAGSASFTWTIHR